MVPHAEGGGGDEGEPEGGKDDRPSEHLGEGSEGRCAYGNEAKSAEGEGKSGGVDGGHGGFDFLECDDGERPAGSGGEHVDCSEEGIARACAGGVDGEADTKSTEDESEPLAWSGPGSFLDERGEDHPPETAGGDKKCGEAGAGDGDGLVEKDVLDKGLGEGEKREGFPRCGADFLAEVFSKKEKAASRDGETDAGEEEDEGKGAGEVIGGPESVDVLDSRKSASPEKGAEQRGRKGSAEERHGRVITWVGGE